MLEPKKKFISVEDESSTLELLEKIKQKEPEICVSIHSSKNGDLLVWKSKALLVLDVSGHTEYNAVSVLRDLLKQHYPENRWTRKVVEELVSFKEKMMVRIE